jgi:hypothetical protein
MTVFDWHSGAIARATILTKSFRTTQKVRRFFKAECGNDFTFDRDFRAWLKTATGKTLGEAADEWRKRHSANASNPAAPRSKSSRPA